MKAKVAERVRTSHELTYDIIRDDLFLHTPSNLLAPKLLAPELKGRRVETCETL